LNETLAVPNLVGLTEDAAKQRVGSDFKIVVNARKASSGQPKGSILSQDPKPNEQARRSSTISVVVSSGPETTQGGTTAQKIGGLTNAKTPENPKAAQGSEELQDQIAKSKPVGEPDSVSPEAAGGAGDAHRPEAEAR
jgi:beta-lactam-binding protein with PASTA domain